MTNHRQLVPALLSQNLFKDFDKFFVGFDDQFTKMQRLHDDISKNINNYPPYNIKKIDDTHYAIELAVAGFDASEIDIEIDAGKLVIKGNTTPINDEDYLFRGIANRAFTRSFAINDTIEIKNAELINGMLLITLEKLVPDIPKPKKIEIKSRNRKTLLQE